MEQPETGFYVFFFLRPSGCACANGGGGFTMYFSSYCRILYNKRSTGPYEQYVCTEVVVCVLPIL